MDKTIARSSACETKQNKDLPVVLALVFGALLVLISHFCSWFFLLRVVPKNVYRSYELGEGPVSEDPDDYLTGLHYFHKSAVVDAHDVNIYEAGTYEIRVFTSKETYIYEAEVTDNHGPEIDLANFGPSHNAVFDGKDDEGNPTFELGVDYNISNLFQCIYEPSGYYNAFLYCDGKLIGSGSLRSDKKELGEERYSQFKRFDTACLDAGNVFKFSEKKVYDLHLEAEDEFGNTSGVDFSIRIIDSLPPEIIPYEPGNEPYFATDRPYGAEDLAFEIKDNSGFYSSAIIDGDDTKSKVSVSEIGDAGILLYAVDEEGNENRVLVNLPFDEAPIFVGVRNKCVLTGEDVNLLDHVIAVDNTDGNVTDTITVDDDGFDSSVPGSYKVKYTACDSHGLETTIVSELTVGDEKAGDYYLTEEEKGLLCGYSYFSYDALETYDYEEAVSLVEPTLVNMIERFGNSGYSAGSGFIYKIDEDYVYICTCVHVIQELDSNIEIMFCDKDSTCIYTDRPDYYVLSPENEIAMFCVKTDDIPAEALVELREIYCDEDVYDDLERGQEIVAYSGHWLNKNPEISKMKIEYLNAKFLDDAQNCLKTTHNVKAGMSGTAVFDEKGRLVGVVEGYLSYWDFVQGKYVYSAYQMRIQGLNDLYERAKAENQTLS